MQYLLKIIITASIIVLVSELGKRFSVIAAILASLPLVSFLAILWLYYDTKNIEQIIDFSSKMFWAVLPSLVFFLILPFLLKRGFDFIPSISISIFATFIAYIIYVYLLKVFQ